MIRDALNRYSCSPAIENTDCKPGFGEIVQEKQPFFSGKKRIPSIGIDNSAAAAFL
jgi:hypothetical protein